MGAGAKALTAEATRAAIIIMERERHCQKKERKIGKKDKM
jgi:hypothetical protein